MRFCYIFSDDFSLLMQRIDIVRKEFLSKSTNPCTEKMFWADDLAPAFWDSFYSISLEPRSDFIILRKAEDKKFLADDWKKLSELLGTLREDAFIVICIESAWEKNAPKVPAIVSSQKCYTFSKKKAWHFLETPLSEENVRGYVQKALKSRNIEMGEKTLKILLGMLAPPCSSIDNTLDQLAFIAEERTIEESDLLNLASSTPDLVIFEYIKCLESGKTLPLWERVVQSADVEELFFSLLSLLGREARTLWKISTNDPSLKIHAKALPYKKQIAQRLGKAGIATMFSLLSDADWSIKSGKKQINQVFEELIFRLTLLYQVK